MNKVEPYAGAQNTAPNGRMQPRNCFKNISLHSGAPRMQNIRTMKMKGR